MADAAGIARLELTRLTSLGTLDQVPGGVPMVVNVSEAKAKLSEYVEAATRGERVLICKRNRPVAELRAVETARAEPRPIGLAKGLVVPAAFFDPLPPAIEATFYALGEDEAGGRPLRAAEQAPPYGTPRKGRRR